MTKQGRRCIHLAFRTTAVLLFVNFFNSGVAATFTTKDVGSVHRYHDTEGTDSQSSYRQNEMPGSALSSGTTRSQKRTVNLFHSQFNKSPTTIPTFVRGGSTIERRKNTSNTEKTGAADASKKNKQATPSSSHSKSSLSSSPPSSWTRRDMAIFLSSSFLTVVSSALTAFAPAPALIAELGPERATSTLSMLSACAALTEIVISPAIGSLLDSIGRKPAFIFATACVACLHGVVAIHPSVITICAAKFVKMLCFGSFITTSQVIISDISGSNPERMSSTLGIYFALSAFAFFVGAILAGKLAELGLSISYGSSTVMSALTAVLILFGMKESLHSSKRIPFSENKTLIRKQLLQSPLSSCTSILFRHSKEVRILAILVMIQSLPSHMNDTFQILVKTEWNIGMKDFSSFIAMYGMINIFANIVGSQMVTRLGIKYFTGIATLSSVLAPLGASLLSFRGLIIGIFVGFLAPAQMLGVTSALYVEGAKSNVPQGELAGERSSFLALAKVVGPIWYSFLYVKGKKVFGTGFLPFLFNVGCGLTAFGISQRYLPS